MVNMEWDKIWAFNKKVCLIFPMSQFGLFFTVGPNHGLILAQMAVKKKSELELLLSLLCCESKILEYCKMFSLNSTQSISHLT